MVKYRKLAQTYFFSSKDLVPDLWNNQDIIYLGESIEGEKLHESIKVVLT